MFRVGLVLFECTKRYQKFSVVTQVQCVEALERMPTTYQMFALPKFIRPILRTLAILQI